MLCFAGYFIKSLLTHTQEQLENATIGVRNGNRCVKKPT